MIHIVEVSLSFYGLKKWNGCILKISKIWIHTQVSIIIWWLIYLQVVKLFLHFMFNDLCFLFCKSLLLLIRFLGKLVSIFVQDFEFLLLFI